MEQMKLFDWYCPRCGHTQTWIGTSRLDSPAGDTLKDTATLCDKCGLNIEVGHGHLPGHVDLLTDGSGQHTDTGSASDT